MAQEPVLAPLFLLPSLWTISLRNLPPEPCPLPLALKLSAPRFVAPLFWLQVFLRAFGLGAVNKNCLSLSLRPTAHYDPQRPGIFRVFPFFHLPNSHLQIFSRKAATVAVGQSSYRRVDAATMLRGLLLSLLVLTSAAQRFSLLKLKPQNLRALNYLNKLALHDDKYKLDFWREASHLGDSADVMIAARDVDSLGRRLLSHNITYSVAVPDVEKLIRRNEGKPVKGSLKGRLKDDPILDSEPDTDLSKVGKLRAAKYPFGDYASYATMLKYMRTIAFYYSNISQTVRIGTTHEGKPIEGLKIGRPRSDGSTKRAVWIDGNIHAREWASSHTALYVINQLVSGYGKDDEMTRYVDTLDFYVIPCLNPDGYEFSRSSPMPPVRLWRKNRSPAKCQQSVWGGERCCQGVDLNRNFEFHWAESGVSKEPCSNVYPGDEVFSEPEARAVRDFLTSPEASGRVDAFVTLHSYAQLWIYPYSHAEASYPEDVAQLRQTARKAINRLASIYGTEYRMGTGAEILTPAAGGSDDWAKSAMGIKYVYLVELRPELELSNGFILHKKELIPTAVETFEGVKEVINAVLQRELEAGRTTPVQTTETTTKVDARIAANLRKKYRMRLLASRTTTTSSTITITTEKVQTTKLATTTELSTTPAVDMPSSLPAPTIRTRFRHHEFFTQTKPPSFLDPECRDMRYSCSFWLRANHNVCEEQRSFMRAQCAFTCQFCVSKLVSRL